MIGEAPRRPSPRAAEYSAHDVLLALEAVDDDDDGDDGAFHDEQSEQADVEKHQAGEGGQQTGKGEGSIPTFLIGAPDSFADSRLPPIA